MYLDLLFSYCMWNNLTLNSLICMFLINTCYIYSYYFTIWNFRRFLVFKQIAKIGRSFFNLNIIIHLLVTSVNAFITFIDIGVLLIQNINIVNIYIYWNYRIYQIQHTNQNLLDLLKYTIFINYRSFQSLDNLNTKFEVINRSEYTINLEFYKSTIYDFNCLVY